MRIFLYLCIPAHAERVPLRRSGIKRASAQLRRLAQQVGWRLGRPLRADYHLWQRFTESNLGDRLVRVVVRAELTATFAPEPVEFVELAWGDLGSLDPETLRCDLFVLAGGGYLFLDSEGRLPTRVREDLRVLARLSCPKIAFGIGMNQLDGVSGAAYPVPQVAPESMILLRQLADTLDLIMVRDGMTHDAWCGAEQKAVVTGDPVFLHRARSRSSARVRAQSRGPRIGLNLALHGAISARRLATWIESYAAYLHLLRAETGATFHYFIHSDTERCIPAMLRSRGISVEPIVIEDLASARRYADMDLMVCQMLHAAILGVASDVPTLNLAYDLKNYGFYALLGLTQYCIPSTDFAVDRALGLTRELLLSANNFRHQVDDRLERLRPVQASALAELRRLVRR